MKAGKQLKFKNRSWTGIKYYHWGFRNGWWHFWLSQGWRGATGIFCDEVKETKDSITCVIHNKMLSLQECQYLQLRETGGYGLQKEAVINEVGTLDIKCHGNKCVIIGRQREDFASFGIGVCYGQSLKVLRMNIIVQQNESVMPWQGDWAGETLAMERPAGRLYRLGEWRREKWWQYQFLQGKSLRSQYLTYILFLCRTTFFHFPCNSLTSETFKFFWGLGPEKGKKILSNLSRPEFLLSHSLVCHNNIALREIVGKQASEMQFQQHSSLWLAVKSKHRSCYSEATHLRLSVKTDTTSALHE